MLNQLSYLNLGCGNTFHKSWTNVDFVSTAPEVKAHNLLVGVPFSNNVFEVVYHSHVLEHFPKDKALYFIKECHRVLKPNGIIRIAIPDLEKIAKNYLKYLEESLNNVPKAAEKYEWTLLEMYDQVVRNESGGEMIHFIQDETKGIDDFLLERNGKEVKLIMDNLRYKPQIENKVKQEISIKKSAKKIKNIIKKLIIPKPKEIPFRAGGEIHQWMYDRYSLKLLLEQCGFKEVKVVTAFTSSINDWNRFELDGKNNYVRKPDSLFIEARK